LKLVTDVAKACYLQVESKVLNHSW